MFNGWGWVFPVAGVFAAIVLANAFGTALSSLRDQARERS